MVLGLWRSISTQHHHQQAATLDQVDGDDDAGGDAGSDAVDGDGDDSYELPLVDRPTQLIHIGISICCVGGGNPCGAADFCFSGVYCQKKQASSGFFSKYLCHVHEDCLEAQIATKNKSKTSKKN